jgi:hypothetical protein
MRSGWDEDVRSSRRCYDSMGQANEMEKRRLLEISREWSKQVIHWKHKEPHSNAFIKVGPTF